MHNPALELKNLQLFNASRGAQSFGRTTAETPVVAPPHQMISRFPSLVPLTLPLIPLNRTSIARMSHTTTSVMAQELWRPDGVRTQVQELVSLYSDHAMIHIPTDARITPGPGVGSYKVMATTATRDLKRMVRKEFTRYYHLMHHPEKVLVLAFESDSQELDSKSTIVKSGSGTRVAVFRSEEKEGKKNETVDILINNQTKCTISLTEEEKHGPIVQKAGTFCSFFWSPDESKVLFLAEKKEPKSESYFKVKKQTNDEKKEATEPGNEFLFKSDWGEQLTGVVHPVVCVLDIESQKVTVIDVDCGCYSLASGQWVDNETVVFVGYESAARKLGRIYCENRRSVLFKSRVSDDAKAEAIVGHEANLSVRDARVSPDGKRLVYLENSSGGTHQKASRLCLLDLETNASSVIVDYHIPNNSDLKALFVPNSLPDRIWSSDSEYVIFSATSHQKDLLVCVNVQTKELSVLSFKLPSVRLLDFDGSVLVVVASSSTTRPVLFAAEFNPKLVPELKWTSFETPVVEDMKCLKTSIPTDDGSAVYTMLLSQSDLESERAATIIDIHGGPHSTYTDSYSSERILFAKLGFKVLTIDYRGSIGYDEKFVTSLPGKAGHMDVEDCILAVDHHVNAGHLDKRRLVLWGGSHGGFLAAHLSAQYAHYDWLSCGLLNPVIDISTMIETSDIPDWCVCESLGKEWDETQEPIDPNLMLQASPYKWISKVKVPTLMLLGKEDARVPMSQGLKWYYGLKARAVETKCHVYPDCHSLAKVEVDSDLFVNFMVWVLSRLTTYGVRK